MVRYAAPIVFSLSVIASLPTAEAQTSRALGRWTVGIELIDTDCDTEEISFLKDTIGGMLTIESKVRRSRGRVTTINSLRFLGAEWVGKLSTSGFKGTSERPYYNTIRRDTFKVYGVRRKSGMAELKGTVSYMGQSCSYLYEGSIS